MKKMQIKAIVVSGLIGVMLLTLTGCRAKHSLSKNNYKNKYSIALITDISGVDDHSFTEAAWKGFEAFGQEHELSRGMGGYQYFQSNSEGDFVPNFNQAANAGFETLYGVGYALKEAVSSAAQKYPKKNFVIMDDVITGQKNVVSATFKSNESSYLAGVVAAYTTKTNTVGFIGGARSTVLDLFEAGFKQGVTDTAKKLGKKITILDQYVGDFTSTDKAKAIAQSMYAKKADILYQAAATAGNGVFQEAKNLNKTRSEKKKVWVIGVDSDQSARGEYTNSRGKKDNCTLTSVLKGLGFAVKDIADKAYLGKFPGGKHLVYGLEHNGVSITKGNLSAKAWQESQEARSQIINGKITVRTSPK